MREGWDADSGDSAGHPTVSMSHALWRQGQSPASEKQSVLTLHTPLTRGWSCCARGRACVRDVPRECILLVPYCICYEIRLCVRQARLTKDQRWGSTLLSRHQSLEEEFERAKAAVEVSGGQLSKPWSVTCRYTWPGMSTSALMLY